MQGGVSMRLLCRQSNYKSKPWNQQEQLAREHKKKVRAAYMRFYRSVRGSSIVLQPTSTLIKIRIPLLQSSCSLQVDRHQRQSSRNSMRSVAAACLGLDAVSMAS